MDGTKLGAATVLALTAACSSPGAGPGVMATGSSGGGHGGAPSQGVSTSTVTSSNTVSSSAVATVSTGSLGSGGAGGIGGGGIGGGGIGGSGGTGACDPPAATGSLWSLEGLRYPDFQPVSMCEYRGDVTLIVNTAAV